jgi:RNA polymerase sigma-70 factor (ECF subfamily)
MAKEASGVLFARMSLSTRPSLNLQMYKHRISNREHTVARACWHASARMNTRNKRSAHESLPLLQAAREEPQERLLQSVQSRAAGGADGMSNDICAQLGTLRSFLIARARRLGVARSDVEDLVQDTLIRAYRYRARFDGQTDGELKAWLNTMMYNIMVTGWRRRALYARKSHLAETAPVSGDSAMESYEMAKLLERIDALPAKLRNAMSQILSGMEYQEIAEAHGISINTVKSRVFRAREALAGAGN